MFFRSFLYTLKQLIREKSLLFWSLFFPIILGTMFFVAFSGLSSDEQFSAIPVAVVLSGAGSDSADFTAFTDEMNFSDLPEDLADNADELTSYGFTSIIDTLSEPGDDQFLSAVYVSEEEALSLLESKEIVGILYEETPVRLSVSAEMTTMKLEQSILNSFVEQYNMSSDAIKNIAMTHPKKIQDAVNALTASVDYNTETSFSDGNMEEKLVYFFNLIAMTCLFSAMGGMNISIYNQANLSSLGMRRNISPMPKTLSFLSEIFAYILVYFGTVLVSLIYLVFILKIDFGNNLGYVALGALVGCITGVTLGFFVGSFGALSENMKMGILMGVIMLCCFLSGLMVGSIQVLIAQVCPWFNHVNPAALIANSFYSLAVCQSHDRYYQNLITLLIISAIFCIGGFLLTRRKKYAAL